MKIEERAQARRLRMRGQSIPRIAAMLGVSKGSVSLWVRDMPQPEKFSRDVRSRRRLKREERELAAREKRLLERLSRPVYSGDVGRRLIRTPEGYKGTTLIHGRYVYEHRYIAEKKLRRLLHSGEVVHHINGNIHDNRPENLEVKSTSRHAREHRPKAAVVTLICPTCRKKFGRVERDYRFKKSRGQLRFFCSRKCNIAN